MSRRNPNIKREAGFNIDPAVLRRRKISEGLASAGMLLVAVGLVVPLFNMLNAGLVSIFKWVFAFGSIVFLAGRCVKTSSPSDSVKLRRLRHMEFWAGMCFVVAAGLWFYNEYTHAALAFVGPLAIMRDTILFALAGAVIQLIASWMIYYQEKKAARESAGDVSDK